MSVDKVRSLFLEVSRSFESAASSGYPASVQAAIELLTAAFETRHKLLVFGNGGSAADAEHICSELVGRFLIERPGLPAICLNSNPAVLTAWANDHSYEDVFARQIQALGAAGDVAWGISTSGNSKNVIAGLTTARAAGLRTIGMTGTSGGRLASVSDVLLAAPSSQTPRIQEIHLATYHAICAAVEEHVKIQIDASLKELVR